MLSFIEDASVMVSVHSSKTQTKIEVDTVNSVKDPEVGDPKPQEKAAPPEIHKRPS